MSLAPRLQQVPPVPPGQRQTDQGLPGLRLDTVFDRKDLKRALFDNQEQRLHRTIRAFNSLKPNSPLNRVFLITASSVNH